MHDEVFLMSPPRADWRIRGSANVFSRTEGGDSGAVAQGAALREWLTLVDAMVDAGASVALLPATDDATLTGMPYTAEAGHLGSDARGPVFLLPSVKPPHRRGEAQHVGALMRSWGVRTWTCPAPWEGQGDVLDAGGRRLVCTSGEGPDARSSVEAWDHVAPLLGAPSIHVRFRGDPWFHGNTFLGFFHAAGRTRGAPAATVALLCEDALLPGEAARLRAFLPDVRFVELSVEDSLRYPTNALQVEGAVLAPRGAPAHVERAWRDLGLDVRPLDLPVLFGRGGGAAVCMTNRLALALDVVPPSARYAAARPALRSAAGLP